MTEMMLWDGPNKKGTEIERAKPSIGLARQQPTSEILISRPSGGGPVVQVIMSWMGSHYTEESKEALRELNHSHCRRCKYRARLHWDHKWFGAFTCSRCGQVFPAEAIERLKWFFKLRAA